MSDTETDALDALEVRLGHRFRRRDVLERALTHRSWAHETGGDVALNYERLEFLGDSLLGFLAAHRLVEGDPGADEGTLTRRKQVVVRTESLAAAADRLGLGAALRLSRGEDATGGRTKTSLLADAFEAVLGAIYLDGGLRAARRFVRVHLADAIARAEQGTVVDEDYKTRLQERMQAQGKATPRYRIVAASGPDHERVFRAEVRIGSRPAGRGEGPSRKRAEQAAAADALVNEGDAP